jgi:hypothetical protein
MRILVGRRVVGLDQCPGFDCPKDPLPDHVANLLCQLNEAERRGEVLAEADATMPKRGARLPCYAIQ